MNTIDKAWVQLQNRLLELMEEERGDGGGSALTSALLAAAGIVLVGLVVGAIAVAGSAAINAISGK